MFSQNLSLRRSWAMVIQCAGAHRKPRWLPVAKSKIFRIPKRPQISEEERLELLRINNNYKTQMRAIKRFFHEELLKESSTLESATSEMSIRLENEEWERCMKLNEQWNAQIAADRTERRKRQRAEMEEKVLLNIEKKEAELKEKIMKASEEIRLQKELSSTFITPDTLDDAIEKALANPSDYNFAVDLQGHQYHGRETPILPPDNQKEIANSTK